MKMHFGGALGLNAQDSWHSAARDFGSCGWDVDELLVQLGEINQARGGGLTHNNPSCRAYEEVQQAAPE